LNKIKTNCPVCNSCEYSIIYNNHQIVKCNSCHVIYPNFIYTKDGFRELYQSYADNSHMSLPNINEVDNHGLCRKYFFNEMLGYIKCGNMLDVGCGWGAFLYNAKKNNFNVTGCEYTKKCVDYANNILGIKVYNADLMDIHFEDDTFDVVVMNHVLEHLLPQYDILERLKHILKKNGIFCGIVPNIGSFCSKQMLEKWNWLDVNYHYVHYDINTLSSIFNKYNFEVMKIYTAADDYDIKEIYKNISIVYNIDTNDKESLDKKRIVLENLGMGESIRFFVKNIK
jgi:2-polyprenyl-3-methyl-5-hydroxy-6-metoxy-1,4-benzoquinol methylase